MKVIKFCTDGVCSINNIENTLEALQHEVGGYIETITLAADCCMIVDEEGRLKDKPLNEQASRLGWLIVGDALFVGVAGEEFADVPEAMIEMCKDRWDIEVKEESNDDIQ